MFTKRPDPRRRTLGRVAYAAVVSLLVSLAVWDAGSGDSGGGARTHLTLMAPAAPGGGWDLAARESQQALRGAAIVNNVEVVNVPGAAGTIGLSQIAQRGGESSLMMITGAVMVGGIELSGNGTTFEDVTPIARLADDYGAVVVPADSPYRTLEDLLDAWRQDPHGTAIGGGSIGGTDHLIAGLLAREAGIDPEQLNYIAYPGGGEVTTSLLSHTVVAGVSGYNDFSDQIEAGRMRALALSADDPVDGIDVPTFVEQGYDVSLPNWRGLLAPPGVNEEQRAELEEIATELARSPEWADTLERNRWADSFMTGDEFEAFLADETGRVHEIIEELGL
ncbi:Bug family tripartite tricarboxylate transporter substrate binding protein [Streptomyces sedi]|uniref:Tripartite tricarboxylate transporter substrate binding protein n=1 Tax=Streptomyces sedi TaxID=555059 RepID=A0A5C4UV44_9ACTN|nr:tripartite tricarboxylate transporter substrate-binding protein [Streptomyces sedi]TNM27530.1 tripartite tricarboxylate transporter substrate binding protein [Streptomyces sedi]